jgi:IclR family acetate operon transcriptional repressor
MQADVPVKTSQIVFEVIETLLEKDGARLTEMVEAMDMAESTLHDHLQTLEAIGMLVRDGNEYRVSTMFIDLGERVRRQRIIYDVGHEAVSELAEETGEHASLMIEENGKGVLLDIEKGDDAVDLGVWAGWRTPLTVQAPGKAILAHLPEDRREEVLEEQGLPSYTDRTITSRSALDEELEAIRDRGYSTDTGELIRGVKAIAVPIFDRGTVAGAISVGGPANRMRGKRFEEDLPDRLLRVSNVIELNIAHN